MKTNVTAQMVMDLRKRTGVGMTKCKEALVEANGDEEEAIHILRKKGIASAVKKSARETNEGVIGYAEDAKGAYLVEVNAETDFVTQNEIFKEFIRTICLEALQTKPGSVEEFLKQKYRGNPSLTIDEYRAEIVHSLGENIQIRRLLDFKKQSGYSLGIYSHMGGKIVAVVVLKGAEDVKEVAYEVAMHVAAEAPDFLRPEDISQKVLEREKEIARSQIQNKPPAIIEKVVEGKIKSFYEQTCLLYQKFVKDPSITIAQFVQKEGEKKGKTLELVEFVRWQMGE